MKRNFSVVAIPKLKSSVFTGEKPSQVASKVFNEFANKKKKLTKTIKLIDNDTQKTFVYKVSRVADPRIVKINGKSVTFKYQTTVKSKN